MISAIPGIDSGPKRLFASSRDVTERKRNEEQIALLMGEVNHRSKNMLSLVQAIAHQTAASNPKEFTEHFSHRIQALAANQDLLVRNDWQGIGIAELVRAQLAHFAGLIGTRITLGGPALRLSTAAAQAIGLALHELATNAGKYGALSTTDGCVEIDWHLDGDVFQIGWTERNGPPVQPPRRKGFGTTVIASMAKMSLDGTVEFTYAATGVVWRLTCPAVKALEQSAGGES